MHLTKDTDNLAKCFHFLKQVILGDYFLSILLVFLQYFFFLVATDPLFLVLFWYAEDTNYGKSKGFTSYLCLLFSFFLFSWAFAIQAIFIIPCIKGGRCLSLLFFWNLSCYAAELSLGFCCCMTVCNVFSLEKKKKRRKIWAG